jgi:transposase
MKDSKQDKTSRGVALRRQWQQHLEGWRSSGTTQIAYCMKHGLSRHAFQYWKHQLDGSGHNRFVEVKQSAALGSKSPIEILLAEGVRIRVPQGASPEELRMVLDVLREP